MEDVKLQRIYLLETGNSPLTSEYLDWRKIYKEQVSQIWEEKYNFLMQGNIYLTAQYDLKNLKQKVILEAINPKTGEIIYTNSILCIHTAIIDIPAHVVENRKTDPEFYKEMLKIQSSEKIHPLNLSPGEAFFALKSWVQGISEAGFNAIAIQRDIETYAHLMYPLSHFLFKSMLYIDNKLVIDFIRWIKKECTFENGPHIPSIAANLLHITEMLFKDSYDRPTEWEQYAVIIGELMELMSYSLRYRLEDKKFFMQPISRILQYIMKEEQYSFGNQFIQWICETFGVRDIEEVEDLREFICSFLDKFTAHYWILQKFKAHIKDYLKNQSPNAVNEIDVRSFVEELQDLGISSAEVYHFLKIYRKDGFIIKMGDIIKSKRGKIAIPASNLSDLQIKIDVTERLARDSVKIIPSPSFYLKHRKYSFLFQDVTKNIEDLKVYLRYSVEIRGVRYFCRRNFNTNPDDIALDLSNSHLNSLNDIEEINSILESVTHLNLSGNPIHNLKLINKFTKLKVLNLKGTLIRKSEQIQDIIKNLSHLHTILLDYRVLKPIMNSLSHSEVQKIEKYVSRHSSELQQNENNDCISVEHLEPQEVLFRTFLSCYEKAQDNWKYPEISLVILIRKYLKQKRIYMNFWKKSNILLLDEKMEEILT